MPERGIYDNMKTAADKVGRGKERVVNARFRAMVSHFLFEAEFCNPAAAGRKVRWRRTCAMPAIGSCRTRRPSMALPSSPSESAPTVWWPSSRPHFEVWRCPPS